MKAGIKMQTLESFYNNFYSSWPRDTVEVAKPKFWDIIQKELHIDNIEYEIHVFGKIHRQTLQTYLRRVEAKIRKEMRDTVKNRRIKNLTQNKNIPMKNWKYYRTGTKLDVTIPLYFDIDFLNKLDNLWYKQEKWNVIIDDKAGLPVRQDLDPITRHPWRHYIQYLKVMAHLKNKTIGKV